jgi:hypothetical protein
MNVELGIAGLISVALGLGHETLGLVWVLPGLTEERVPGTRFGPPSMTVSMVRVTWHIVTIFAMAAGGLLMTLAWSEAADPRTLLLRWFAAMWIVAAAMAFWVARVRVRNLLRLPVPLLWVVIAVLLWKASA